MTQYLISFSAHAMDHLPRRGHGRRGQGRARGGSGGGEYRRVCAARQADWKASGRASWPPTGRSPRAPTPEVIGGLTVVNVPSREEALEWAAKIAVACRCAQEVRAIGPDPELDAMLRQADRRR